MFISFILITLIGCATTVPFNQTADGVLQSYYGHEFHAAILNFGPPDAIYNDGNNGRILHWQETSSRVQPGASVTTSTGTASMNAQSWHNVLWGNASYSGQSYTATMPPRTVYNSQFIQIYINPDGLIYHHRTNMLSPAERQAQQQQAKYKQYGQLSAILGGAFLIGAIYALSAE